MQFGRVAISELDKIDFLLPENDPDNLNVLGGTKSDCEVFIGGTGWGVKEWIGTIYPKGTKQGDFLSHYGKFFNTVELNATHYRIFKKEVVQKWESMVEEGFRFCPKFLNTISHYRRLNNVNRETIEFAEQIREFGLKLGPSFLQLRDGYSDEYLKDVLKYIENFPREFPVVVEFRDDSWFNKEETWYDVRTTFESLNTGVVITDTAGRRDVLHSRLTTPFAFIRWVGNSLHPTDYKRIDDWIDRIGLWIENGLEQLYFFVHMHDELESPVMIQYLIRGLNEKLGLNIPEKTYLNSSDQITLF